MPIRERKPTADDLEDEPAQTFADPIGKNPKSVPVQELLSNVQCPSGFDPMLDKYRKRITSPLTAIRAICVECAGGISAVRQCGIVSCPNWAFRMGHNPFFGKLREDPNQPDQE